MAYPFAQMPRLSEFIDRVISDEYEARIETIKLSGPRGEVETRVLVRKMSKEKIAVIPDLKDDDILTPHVLRSLCVQLAISPKDFGFPLD